MPYCLQITMNIKRILTVANETFCRLSAQRKNMLQEKSQPPLLLLAQSLPFHMQQLLNCSRQLLASSNSSLDRFAE